MGQFCSHCGNAVAENSLYCNRCGMRVGASTAVPEAAPTPAAVTVPSRTAASEEWIAQYRYGDQTVKELKKNGGKLFANIMSWAGAIAFVYSCILYINTYGSVAEGLLIGLILSGGASFIASILVFAKFYLASGVFSFASALFGLVCAAFPWAMSSHYFDIDDADDVSIFIYTLVCFLLVVAVVFLSISSSLSEKYARALKKCHIALTETHVLGYYITKSFNPKPTYFELNYSDIRAVRCDSEDGNNFFIDYIGGNIAMDLKEPEKAMKNILEKRREIVS